MSFAAIWKSVKAALGVAAKNPVVKQGEVVTVELVEAEFEAVLDKFLGADSPLDKDLDTILRELAVKVVAKINAQ